MATILGNVNLFVRNIEQAKRFYVEGIGLIEDKQRSQPPSFVLLQSGETTLTLQDASTPGAAFGLSPSVELGFKVDDLEAVRVRLAAWPNTVSEVQQMGWGSGFDAVDPDGHRLTLYRMRE